MDYNFLGKAVVLFSKSSERYLAGPPAGEDPAVISPKNPFQFPGMQWDIERVNKNQYFIRNTSSSCFLDGRSTNGEDLLCTNRPPFFDNYLLWEIYPTDLVDYYVFRSVSSHGFMDGRNADCTQVLVTNRNWQGDHYFYWRILPGTRV